MKRNCILISFFIIFISCSNNDNEIKNEVPTTHPQLVNLQKPDVNLKIIENGDFNSNIINSISYINFNNKQQISNFEVFENTKRIKRITIHNPDYLCITSISNYYYENNVVSEIEIIDEDVCNDYTRIIELKYNYELDVLTSIFISYYYLDVNNSKKLMQVGENYFSYNPNGTIAEIFYDIRLAYEPLYGYAKLSYLYDSNNNVKEVKQENYYSNTYDQKYIFEYSDDINPLKGIYIFSGGGLGLNNFGVESNLGPVFLSNNCIKSVKSEYLYHPNNFDNTKFFTTNSINNKILDYGSEPNYQYWFRNYIN